MNISAVVTIRPTVPVVPMPGSGGNFVRLSVYLPYHYGTALKQAAASTCDVKLRSTDITYGVKIEFKGVCDIQNEEKTDLEFHFGFADPHPFWILYRLKSVKVRKKRTRLLVNWVFL
jgi:hypothetical protein